VGFVLGDLAEAVGNESEPQMNQRIVAILPGDLDRGGFESRDRDAVRHETQRIAQRLQIGAISGGLDEREEQEHNHAAGL